MIGVIYTVHWAGPLVVVRGRMLDQVVLKNMKRKVKFLRLAAVRPFIAKKFLTKLEYLMIIILRIWRTLMWGTAH